MEYVLFIEEDHEYLYMAPTLKAPGPPAHPASLSATTYLDYAREDLKVDSERGLVNAFGSIKRALHLIVDSTLNAYGLYTLNKRRPFPKKLALLDSAGLIPISIINKLNIERNVMEHEYTVPDRERVKEALDVGHLLLLATTTLVEFVPYECVVSLKGNPARHLLLRMYPELGMLRFYSLDVDSSILHSHEGVEYIATHRRDGSRVARIVAADVAHVKQIELRHNNVDEWSVPIRALIKLEGLRISGLPGKGIVPDRGGAYTVSVALAMDDETGYRMADLFRRIVPDRLFPEYESLPSVDSQVEPDNGMDP